MTEQDSANTTSSPGNSPISEEGGCPSFRELSRLLYGTADSLASVAMQEHLDACERCVKLLDELVRGVRDPILMALRHSSAAEAFHGESNCRDVVRSIAQAPLAIRESSAPAIAPPLAQLGSYRFVEKIAEGGMGVVYRAVHIDLNKTVALKLLRHHLPLVPQMARRFRRECRALGQMQHPNLVAAFDAGVIEGTPFLVMEFIEGIDLSQLLKQLGFLRVADACEIIRQAALGLEHANQKGVVHRDVKPSNLMLTRDSQGLCIVKVLDLGLARLLKTAAGAVVDDSNLSRDGQIMGTRAYMSPEQARDSHEVDTRADVYSLGATLHELLVGQPPPQPVTETLNLSVVKTALSHSLFQLMESLLAFDLEQRPVSPGEMAQRLEPFAVDHEIHLLL